MERIQWAVRLCVTGVFLFALALAAGQALAAENLIDIYRLALAQDPQFRQVVQARHATLEAHNQARSRLLLPSVAFTGNVIKNYQDITFGGEQGVGLGGTTNFTAKQYSLNLTQPIFHYDRYVEFKQAGDRSRQANIELDSAHQDLLLRAVERYIGVLSAMDGLTFARAEKEALSRQLEESNQRFEVGLIAITDVQEARAGYHLAVANEIQAENALDNAREALREVTAEYHSELATLGEAMPLVEPDPTDIDAWTRLALRQNLRIAAIQAESDVAKAEIRRQYAGHLPSLDLVSSYGSTETGGRFGDTTIDTTTVGVEFNVPIYEGGQVNSRTRESTHRYREALERLEQRRREVQRQTRDAFLGVIAGISRVRALKQAVVSSETAVEATEAGFAVGTRTAVDVVNQERDLFEAKRDLAQARYDYLLSTLRLKQAVGTLSPDDLAEVNEWLENAPPSSDGESPE